MNKTILLNNQIFHLSKKSLPLLIHGKEGIGASLLTVSIVADLFLQNSKLLFLCGYSMARDEFLEQTSISGDSQNVIFVTRENPKAFIDAVNTLPDINERVILIKNIELFDDLVFSIVEKRENLIISGDLDKCSFSERLIKKQWNTKILFSKSKVNLGIVLPNLNKYEGFLNSSNNIGIISLKTD